VPLTDHENCLLIIIDAQPGFYPTDMSEIDRAAAETALTRAAWLTALAAALAMPIVVTEEEPERNGRTDWRFPLPPETPVLVKPTFGLAGTPAILDAVQATGRRTAVLVGFETDVCVFQSAIGLQDTGLEVIAVEDATFSPGEMHGRGLERLRDAGVRLTHCKSLAYEWVRTVERSTELLSSGVLGPAPFKL